MNKEHTKKSPDKELTPTAIITGIILACVFSGANAYLGLRVGMTVSASIPAAVVSMGIIRLILKRNSVRENNIVQTIGSAGESVAAGAIFTIPVLFMWAEEWNTSPPSLTEIFLITLCGGILGVMFMVPLRRALIIKEKDTLPYPEGTACSEVLLAGESKGSSASTVFRGMSISALYNFFSDGMGLFPSELHKELTFYKGSGIGLSALPALTGVGYICGFKISAYMFAGGVLAWLVIMPLISFFGGNTLIAPAQADIGTLTSTELWSSYIRYIGAGAVASGGIISLLKSLPLIGSTFIKTIKGFDKEAAKQDPRDTDISYSIILATVLIVMLVIWLSPAIPVTLLGAGIIVLFGFFFTAVSSRLVGLVGSSNNPVSGMTIATLLIAALILKMTGTSLQKGMTGAIAIGSVICIIASVAGDTSQDLKTGYILGATPKKQQIGELIGVVASSLVIGLVLYLMNRAWGYGSAELPAPQAALMKIVTEGVMGGSLPWTLVIIGAFIALTAEIIGIPVLPLCIGLYLPFSLSSGIMTGGLIRLIFDKLNTPKEGINNGILYCSGLIAGEGLTGILLAVLAIIPIGSKTFHDFINVGFSLGSIGTLIVFALLLYSLYRCRKGSD
mgnify:CR=1 FL=1